MPLKRIHGYSLLLILLVVGLLSTPDLLAQETKILRGELSGTITDTTGARVPAVEISAEHVLTNFVRTHITDDTGFYVLSGLPIGDYELSAQLAGFREYRHTLTLGGGDRKTVNIQLEVGEVTDTIEVIDTAPIIQMSDATIGENLSSETLETVPVNGRDFGMLLLLQPGAMVMPNHWGQPGRASDPGAPMGLSYNGAHDNWGSTNITLDGVDVTQVGSGLMSSNSISVEAIQEVAIDTTNLSAEVGRSAGGKVVFISKSGTNEFHGSLFEYSRPRFAQANEFLSNAAGDKLGESSRHQYGGSIGGPFIKDKLFGFYTFERIDAAIPSTFQFPAPSAAFKATLAPQLRKYFDLVPLPNTLNEQEPRIGPVNLTGTFNQDNRIHMPRVDVSLGNHTAFFRWNRVRLTKSNGATLGGYPDFPLTNQNWQDNTTVSWNSMITPTLINEVGYGRATYSGLNNSFSGITEFIDPAKGDAFGRLNVLQEQLLPGAYPHKADTANQAAAHFLHDNLRWVKGSHQISVGGEFRRVLAMNGFDFWPDYAYETLDDLAANSVQTATNRWGDAPFPFGPHITHNGGAYVQDDWKVSPRLTLNVGFRWDWEGAIYNRADPPNGHLSFLKRDPSGECSTCPNGQSFGHLLNCTICTPGDFIIPGTNIHDAANDHLFTRVGQKLRNGDMNNLSPRIGMAYDLTGDGTTVLRGGYAVMFLGTTPGSHGGSRTGANSVTPVTIARDDVPSLTFPFTFKGALPAPGSRIAFGFYDHGLEMGHAKQYNVSLQRQLPADIALQVAYVGNKYVSMSSLSGPYRPNPFIPDASHPSGGDTVDPCCNVHLWSTPGPGRYDSLQVTFRKAMSKGIQVAAYYTWSHSLHQWGRTQWGEFRWRPTQEIIDRTNPGFRYPDGLVGTTYAKSSGIADIRHNFISHWLWNIPFSSSGGFADRVLGGWQVSGIVSKRSGMTGLNGWANSGKQNRYRSNSLPNIAPGARTTSGYIGNDRAFLNTSAFSVPGIDPAFAAFDKILLGNAENRPFKGPPAVTMDLSILKQTTIYENHRVEFRAEIFNIFNHMVWDRLVGSLSSARFGFPQETLGSRQISFGIRYVF